MKQSQSKLSSLLARASPRTVPRGTKASPASSGFCSGEEAEPNSIETSPTSPADPVYEVLKEVDSPGLEWDEGGLELGDSAGLDPQHLTDHTLANFEDTIFPKEDTAGLANFENSIFRRDEETGHLHCYQHNTRRGRADAMASIIGHLEEDHRALQDRLQAAPDLVQPVIEAQTQLTRLKGLMANLFASRNYLDGSPEKAAVSPLVSPLVHPVSRHESTRVGSRHLAARGVDRPGMTRHESTRIGGELAPATPRHRRFRAEEPWDNCSPIVYAEVARKDVEEELEDVRRDSNPEYLTLVRVDEEEESEVKAEAELQTGVTFTCLSATEREEESADPDATDPLATDSLEEKEESWSRYTHLLSCLL